MRTVESKLVEVDLREIAQKIPFNDLSQHIAGDTAVFYDALLRLLKSKGLMPVAMRFRIEMDGE